MRLRSMSSTRCRNLTVLLSFAIIILKSRISQGFKPSHIPTPCTTKTIKPPRLLCTRPTPHHSPANPASSFLKHECQSKRFMKKGICRKELYQTPFDSWGTGGSSDARDEESQRKKGILVLLTVPIAWGTYEPAIRLVYQIQPDIPPFLFSFLYYIAAASALSLFAFLETPPRTRLNHVGTEQKNTPVKSEEEPECEEPDSTFSDTGDQDRLSIKGGLELGSYLFIGNGFQVVGLKTVPSDRAAFLLQLTTIFVPLMQAVFARDLFSVPKKTWVACFIALSGVAFMGLDGSETDTSSLSSLMANGLGFSQGDLLIVLAAFSYTFHCIRLEIYAKTTSAIKLAVSKAATETIWSLLVVMTCVLVASAPISALFPDLSIIDVTRASGENILAYKGTIQTDLMERSVEAQEWLTLSAAILWVGLVTVAYTITAQSYGQARVVPATANLIYTLQPVFTSLFAWGVLGETLGAAGYVGGFLIGSAVLLVIKEEDHAKDDKANDGI